MAKEELEKINVEELDFALPGKCFHGEVWVKCPYCKKAHEMMGCHNKKNGYHIVKCECGNFYRVG